MFKKEEKIPVPTKKMVCLKHAGSCEAKLFMLLEHWLIYLHENCSAKNIRILQTCKTSVFIIMIVFGQVVSRLGSVFYHYGFSYTK